MESLTQAASPATETVQQPGSNGSVKVVPPLKSPRKLWPIAVLAGILLVVAIASYVITRSSPALGIQASGTIEATESDIAPKVLGRLADLRVHDGDPIKKGQIVAVLERVEPAFNLQQARANVAAAQSQVRAAQAAYDLQVETYKNDVVLARSGVRIAGSRLGQATENLGIEQPATVLAVDQAQAQLRAAQANFDHARTDLSRRKSLVATGDESQQTLDDATDAYKSATAQLQTAKDTLALARANRRNVAVRRLDVASSQSQQRQSIAQFSSAEAERELVSQRHAQLLVSEAQLAQTRAALGIAADQVHETTLLAPFDGFVISHNFEDGDLVQPGSAVMTVGDLAHPYLYVYVSESDLPHVKTGMHADVTIDGMPGRTFSGTVTEISNTAEFTPENVQTKEERIEYLVFRVKIQFTDTTGSLKPGLPADAVIHV